MAKWKVENNYIVDANGAPILRIDQCCSYSSPIKPEVIAQIVREHNSHDALVAALFALTGLREVQRKREGEEFHITGDTFMKIWDELTEKGKAALALAEVKP